MAKEDITTIQVSKEVRDELRAFGKMGETYDDVIKNSLKKQSSVRRNESNPNYWGNNGYSCGYD